MVAAVVSATNKCQYCTLAHAQAIRGENPELELAEFLITTASGVTQDWVDDLRSVGWEDQADKLAFKDDMAPKVFGKIAPTPKAPVA